MQAGLFNADTAPRREPLAAGAIVLCGFARADEAALLDALHAVIAHAPWRNMLTPGGRRMSVAMSNCGALGWISDRRGYRYSAHDPDSGALWPSMPNAFLALATRAADAAGFADFVPDACLINRYEAGTRLSLHQDRNERDFDAPIVSVSLGLPATFLFGGSRRTDKVLRVPLAHGDAVVWGGPARLCHHGVAPLKPGSHPLLGECRVNLTLRKAG